MKERPILFSAPMVNAILAGRKTQTRRIIKPQPEPKGEMHGEQMWHWPNPKLEAGYCHTSREAMARLMLSVCPHGVPGDHLWVRETWTGTWLGVSPYTAVHLHYAADGSERMAGEAPTEYVLPKAAAKAGRWVTPLFMPRFASRITLGIINVRVERLQDISAEDAWEEGCWPPGKPHRCGDPQQTIDAFHELWESINGDGAWAKNPWVWAISFIRITS